jgi:hypothetical protein
MMAENQFSVRVVNPLEALMAGEQGYKDAVGFGDDRMKRAARQQAMQALQSGGDPRGALAQLIGAGDYAGAQVLGALGKTDLTDEIKEYNLSKSQGFKGSFTDWKTGLKLAGAARTNVNTNVNTGEKAYDTKVGGDYGDTFVGLQKAGRNAVGQLGTLDQMEKLIEDPNFYSGVGAEKFALPLKQAVARFGGDPNAAASMETFRALSNKSVLDSMGGSLGTGFSNADRDFVVGQTQNLGNTPEGNKQLIQIQRQVVKRTQQIAGFARDYAAKNGRIDAGFDAALSQWAEKNPLFPRGAGASTPQSAPAPTGGQPKRLKFNPATGALE